MTSVSDDNQDNDDNDRCNDDKSTDSCNYDNKCWTQGIRLHRIYIQQLNNCTIDAIAAVFTAASKARKFATLAVNECACKVNAM